MGRCFNETTLYTNGKQVLTIWKGADCCGLKGASHGCIGLPDDAETAQYFRPKCPRNPYSWLAAVRWPVIKYLPVRKKEQAGI